ncbi:ATPase inhibitor subunit zeta [Microvirga sp. CF3016]|uniref:ATPase inhibitor subunit zeta n=1 Tax=Microvirga sp. CF3016 TaxID=3110181 RepID=UPI002E7882D5|nr:ATPase inhibitor subunit zeta [Microvirga sp. CF3016]MEE1609809.1 ATPase inhibitor subunit zeta [Microvirga sp. CF3016]
MTCSDDVQKTILRNKLLGRWAAEKLGLTGRDAEVYSDALARGTVEPGRSDVLSTIRKDFDAAGVAESDARILSVMTELMLKAGNLMPTARGDSTDAAAVTLARKLMSK